MQAQDIASANPNDFQAPWKFSDVVLVVEDQKFHVHRSILAFWSPVFETMFASEFKEKTNNEIPLPGKKASEIKLLLYMMYPSLKEKPVTKSNCYLIFELAHEYQMESIVQNCEAFMLSMVKQRVERDVVTMLIYGQAYWLKTLISTCIYEARRLSLNELKQHKRRDEIDPDNYLQIAEGIIQRLETQCKEVREESLKRLERVSESLYNHVRGKNNWPDCGYQIHLTTDKELHRLRGDVDKSSGDVNCSSLKLVAEELIAQKKALQKLCLNELKQHKKRDEIDPDNYLQIAEGIIQQLETHCKEVREESLKRLERVSESLYNHVRGKNNWRDYGYQIHLTVDLELDRLRGDVDKSSGDVNCLSLKLVAEELIAQKKALQKLC